jgi:hypothetical protein
MQPNARNTLRDFFTQITRPSGISTQSVHTHNNANNNTNNNGNNGAEYDDSKSLNFRESISNIDESDLEAIINQVKEETSSGGLPLQWTSNPVRDSQSESRSSKSTLYPAISTDRKVSGFYSEENSLY